jgi:hypothetical protein
LAAAVVELFREARALDGGPPGPAPLAVDVAILLDGAALNAWGGVEPVTLGGIVTRGMSGSIRRKTGAEYTPRSYVERLARATFAPVFEKWRSTRHYAGGLSVTYQGAWRAVAADLVSEYHAWLCSLRILDPACGTGNILYVCMEMLMEVEADVRRWLTWLDAPPEVFRRRITPANFTGMEINPRACDVAPLVMWASWHQARVRFSLPDLPELPQFNLIPGDAVLTWDKVVERPPARQDRITGVIKHTHVNEGPHGTSPAHRVRG